MCKQKDHHKAIRLTLVDFTKANPNTFAKFSAPTPLEEHTASMKHEAVWGTDLELHAAVSYFRVPFYVCT